MHATVARRRSQRLCGAGARNPRLRAQVRLSQGDRRPERRHRFRADRLPSPWMPWAAENVIGVGMPGPYSSPAASTTPARWPPTSASASKWCPSREIFEAYRKTLEPCFAGCPEDVTEENIQPRIRGAIADGALATSSARWCSPPATSRSWPWATARCMATWCGGLAVISDVPKTHGVSPGRLRKFAARR